MAIFNQSIVSAFSGTEITNLIVTLGTYTGLGRGGGVQMASMLSF